ncbi:MAG: amino acid permease [Jatrophihabitans sp.]|uniref:amino acid permease n=1 Tax=Jatrophihabitans sp. TaxID=1932789 RepID=UPI003F8224C3
MTLFRTKPVEDVLAQQDDDGGEHPAGLRKRLRARDLVGFGVGIVIGTGIFTLTGVEAKNHAGPAVVLSFVLAGVVSLLAALCYTELASSVPTAGSAYTYAYATIGEPAAWIIGWDLVLEFALGAAVVARGWSSYLQDLFDLPTSVFGEHSDVNLGAMFIVAVLGVVAIVGIRESAWVTNTLVAIKVAICLFIIVAGAFYVKTANWHPFVPTSHGTTGASGGTRPLIQVLFGVQQSAFGFAGVLTAAAVVFFAYSGFEAVANLSEETRDPGRDLPRGLLGTLALATALYVGVSLVVTGMVRYSNLDEGAPLSSAFDSVGASWAGTLVSIAAVCGLTSVTLVDIVTMSRIGFAMSRDGLLPRNVAAVHPRFGTPARFTAGTTVVVMLIAGFISLSTLADLVSIGTLFAFVLVSVAVPVLRRTRPDLQRAFRVPLSPVVPILSALACLYLMLNLSIATWIRFAVWLVIGLVVYVGYGRRHALLNRREQPRATARAA